MYTKLLSQSKHVELCAQKDKLLSPMPKTDKVEQKNDPH